MYYEYLSGQECGVNDPKLCFSSRPGQTDTAVTNSRISRSPFLFFMRKRAIMTDKSGKHYHALGSSPDPQIAVKFQDDDGGATQDVQHKH